MKAMFVLTDVTEKDSGNLTVFPGSQRNQIPYGGDEVMTPYSPGARQLMGKAGDVYLFPHSLWHGPAKNVSANARKILLYNYCQLWVRSYDHNVTPDIAQQCSPRQRRLLGDLGQVISGPVLTFTSRKRSRGGNANCLIRQFQQTYSSPHRVWRPPQNT